MKNLCLLALLCFAFEVCHCQPQIRKLQLDELQEIESIDINNKVLRLFSINDESIVFQEIKESNRPDLQMGILADGKITETRKITNLFEPRFMKPGEEDPYNIKSISLITVRDEIEVDGVVEVSETKLLYVLPKDGISDTENKNEIWVYELDMDASENEIVANRKIVYSWLVEGNDYEISTMDVALARSGYPGDIQNNVLIYISSCFSNSTNCSVYRINHVYDEHWKKMLFVKIIKNEDLPIEGTNESYALKEITYDFKVTDKYHVEMIFANRNWGIFYKPFHSGSNQLGNKIFGFSEIGKDEIVLAQRGNGSFGDWVPNEEDGRSRLLADIDGDFVYDFEFDEARRLGPPIMEVPKPREYYVELFDQPNFMGNSYKIPFKQNWTTSEFANKASSIRWVIPSGWRFEISDQYRTQKGVPGRNKLLLRHANGGMGSIRTLTIPLRRRGNEYMRMGPEPIFDNKAMMGKWVRE